MGWDRGFEGGTRRVGSNAWTSDKALLDALQQPMWLVQPNGTVDAVNACWRAEAGLERAMPAESAWRAAIDAEDRTQFEASFGAALSGTAPYEIDVRFRSANGAVERRRAHVAPMLGAD